MDASHWEVEWRSNRDSVLSRPRVRRQEGSTLAASLDDIIRSKEATGLDKHEDDVVILRALKRLANFKND
jgi:hypothetical protein